MLPTREPICAAMLDQTLSQDGVSAELTVANDPWPLKALRVGFELVLHRSIETTRLIGSWPTWGPLFRDEMRVSQNNWPRFDFSRPIIAACEELTVLDKT
jgi:hypothetical protein